MLEILGRMTQLRGKKLRQWEAITQHTIAATGESNRGNHGNPYKKLDFHSAHDLLRE